MTLTPRRGRDRRRALQAGAALAIVLSATASPALAQTVCQTRPDGTVVCSETTGQGYALNARNTSVAFADGASVSGPVRLTGGGRLELDLGEDSRVVAANAPGVLVYSADGQAIARVDDVATTGTAAYGVQVFGAQDARAEATGTVRTGGALAHAVLARSAGSAAIDANELITTGDQAVGALASGGSGLVSVQANRVSTQGNFADGIFALNTGGDVRVSSGTVATRGVDSDGVQAIARGGDAFVEAFDTRTLGRDSHAVEADARDGTASIVSAFASTRGDGSFGLLAYSWFGDALVDAGTVETYGLRARGIQADALFGGDAEVAASRVVTFGADADAINVLATDGFGAVRAGTVETSGAGSRGVFVFADRGASVTAERVRTSGERLNPFQPARGVEIRSYGDVSADLGDVETTGGGADALFVNTGGDVTIAADRLRTFGVDAHGARAHTDGGDVTADLGDVTVSGANADGARLSARAGAVLARIAARARSDQGTALRIDAGRTAVVEVAEGAVVEGETGGISVAAADGSTIRTAGLIRAGDGAFAIDADDGAALVEIAASGVIEGRIDLTDADDRVNNAGLFAAFGDSLFGAGEDRFDNTGTVRIVSPVVAFAGLERFDNGGLIEMRDGRVGGLFDLSSAVYAGRAGGVLAVDAQLSGPGSVADVLRIGRAEGLTLVRVTDVGGLPPAINREGVLVVDAIADSPGGAFALEGGPIGKGFVAYDLAFFDQEDEWRLVSAPNEGPIAAVGTAPLALGRVWDVTGQAWSVSRDALRDAAWYQEPRRDRALWAQAFAGGNRYGGDRPLTVLGETRAIDATYEENYRGLQIGSDRVWTTGPDAFALIGVTAGFSDYETRIMASRDSLQLTGLNVGVYGALQSGPWFVNGLFKADAYAAQANLSSAFALVDFDARAWGAKVEAGARFGSGRLWWEPSATLVWTALDLDDFEVEGSAVEYGDGSSAVARIGARVGGSIDRNGGLWLPHAGLYLVEPLNRDSEVSIRVGGDALSLTERDRDGWAEASFGLEALELEPGFDAYVRADLVFGDEAEGATLRIGVRKRW